MTDHAIYDYIPHYRTRTKLAGGADKPVKVVDQLPTGNLAARFNTWFAVKVTNAVGTMWCAYAFAMIALISLPRLSARTVPSPSCPGCHRPSSSWSCCQ